MKGLTTALLLSQSFVATTFGSDSDLAASLGITPESAVVAGLSPAEASSLLENLNDASELKTILQTHQETLHLATQAVSELSRSSTTSLDDPQTHLAAYLAAVSDLNEAKEDVASSEHALLAAITHELSLQQVARLSAWRESVARKVPPAFRVTGRTAEQWDAIEEALIAEARASRFNVPLAIPDAQLLTAVRSELDVITAQGTLESALIAMNTVFHPN